MRIRSGMLTAVDIAEALFYKSYFNWDTDNQPKFQRRGPRMVDGNLEVEYSTTDTPYIWVSGGTEGPYTITSKAPNGFLRFRPDGRPKTFAGKLLSSQGARGTTWRTAKEVTHPGIEPRKFPELVVEHLQPAVAGIIARAIHSTTGG